MKDLVFCYTFSMKTMKLMAPPKTSNLCTSRVHVLGHGGMAFLEISLISQGFCYIFPREDNKNQCLAQLLCQD